MDRAAHVYIHDGDATGFEDDRRVAQFARLLAEQLHSERRIGGAGFDKLVGAPVFFDKGAGVDEIGGAEADPADLADGEAKRQIGVPGQWCQEQV